MIRKYVIIVWAAVILTGCGEEKRQKQAEELYDAIYQNDSERVHELLQEVNLDRLPVLDEVPAQITAVKLGDIAIIQDILQDTKQVDVKDNAGDTMLHAAAYNGDIAVVKLLLEKGADVNEPNENGWTPLFMALTPTADRSDKQELIDLLLQHGANVDAVTPDGWTTIHETVYKNDSVNLKKLLPLSQHINAKTKEGWTPLVIAVQSNDSENARVLLENGADIEAEDSYGYTALSYAAQYGFVSIVSLLLENGANETHETKNGETCVDLAKKSGSEEIASMLQSAH